MERMLHIVGAMHPGGIENFIMNLYRNIDREELQFDIAIHARSENDYVEEIERMGGRVYVLPRLTSHPIKSLYQLYRIVKNNKYKVVVRHTPNALVAPQLIVAKMAGAKTICHSHNETDPQQTIHKIGRLFMGIATTKRLACSEKAGRWMFGNRDFQVIHNAIDIQRFEYTAEKEKDIRDEYKLGDRKVYGHIANFIASKNHKFLMQVYKEISLIDPEARFFCLGDGSLRKDIEEEVKNLGLQDKVVLTGIRYDANKFMSCFDVLIFPSFFEGLPLTLIEAQSAGLPMIISDTITKDVIVSEGLISMESIEEDPKVWAHKAIELADTNKDRGCQFDMIASHGYDIKTLVKWYQEYILTLAK